MKLSSRTDFNETWLYEMPQACDCLDTMFVNFETSSGTFQLTCYNSHNGYYGHDVTVVSNQLSYTGEV